MGEDDDLDECLHVMMTTMITMMRRHALRPEHMMTNLGMDAEILCKEVTKTFSK